MVTRRIFNRQRLRRHRQRAIVAILATATFGVTLWSSIESYRQPAPTALLTVPAPMSLVCTGRCPAPR
jgi:hypothetical protein